MSLLPKLALTKSGRRPDANDRPKAGRVPRRKGRGCVGGWGAGRMQRSGEKHQAQDERRGPGQGAVGEADGVTGGVVWVYGMQDVECNLSGGRYNGGESTESKCTQEAAVSIVKQQRESLTERVDALHESIRRHGDPGRLAEFSQYFTPPEIARFMASLLRAERDEVRLLDAGAGVGMLTAAAVAELVTRQRGPKRIEAVLYEADSRLAEPLAQTLAWCGERCSEAHISFTSRVLNEDFIAAGVATLQGAMFETKRQAFDAAILNPPYRKIRSDGDTRRLLRLVGIETTNLYSAFVWLAMLLLGNGGEISAITPRSFCNGLYFRNFRRDLLRRTRLTRLHVFEARDRGSATTRSPGERDISRDQGANRERHGHDIIIRGAGRAHDRSRGGV